MADPLIWAFYGLPQCHDHNSSILGRVVGGNSADKKQVGSEGGICAKHSWVNSAFLIVFTQEEIPLEPAIGYPALRAGMEGDGGWKEVQACFEASVWRNRQATEIGG